LIAQKLNTLFDIKKINEFLLNHPNTGIAASAFLEALDYVELNVRWMDTNAEPVKQWLEQRQTIAKC
jgi:hypothetical protein